MADYKEKVKNDGIWIANNKLNNIPVVIQSEYVYLKDSIFNDDICGVLFRLKDIYETSAKIPAIMAIIAISEYMEQDTTFTRKTSEELQEEFEEFKQETKIIEESDAYKKYSIILSRLLREPLSIGAWGELMELIVEYSPVFELDANLVKILSKSIQLLKVKPKKVNGQSGRYDDVGSWRNKTIGHGTLLINTDDYWEQAYDLVKGLYTYFSDDIEDLDLNSLYKDISIVQNTENDYRLLLGDKEYNVSEYLQGFDGEPYFFDSYYSRQQFAEVTNYLKAPRRLKGNIYYQRLFDLITSSKKAGTKKKGRKISNSTDREMYACLNSTPSYEKPTYVMEEIREFINSRDKGVLHVQMERGMGKSTLAHRLDGRYQKGILQKDLNAVVRVYHISDTMLRGENRKKDFFTALNTNLISYAGGQLEVDTDEYEIDGRDLRHQVEEQNEGAQIAFAKYLELFRCRYEDEICDNQDDEAKLVYIIDGIDELNSDTKGLLNAIPSNELLNSISSEDVNNVYIILLSRKRDEAGLPDVAKESVSLAESKAGQICKLDSNNAKYLKLLKKYIQKNYKGISDKAAAEIIERAQHKFLYIHPYMALGEAILKNVEEVSAYSVAKNYIGELQKMYCGVSTNTLQLILASIALFHTVSLKEMCNSVLFTDVTYDVIGVMNDILPLLTTKRTDGEDVYEYSNEEFEQFVFTELRDAVCEVICRFRIYVKSWFDSANYKESNYGSAWGQVVRRVLYIDNWAKTIGFCEVDEEYIQTLLGIRGKNPDTIYSRSVSEQIEINLIELLLDLDFKNLTCLTISDLNKIGLEFGKRNWRRQSTHKLSEYTQRMIQHCIDSQKMDVWFQFIMNGRFSTMHDVDGLFDEPKVEAIKTIFKHWEKPAQLVEYFYQKTLDDYALNPERAQTYAVYFEELLEYITEYSVKEKLFEGLILSYKMMTCGMEKNPKNCKIEDKRRSIILKNISEAEAFKDLNNYEFIEEISEFLSPEYVIEKTLTNLETLSNAITEYSAQEFIVKYFETRLDEDLLTEGQLLRYKRSVCSIGNALLELVKGFKDCGDIEEAAAWLINSPPASGLPGYLESEKDAIFEWLDLYAEYVEYYLVNQNYEKVYELSWSFRLLLKYYDENIRKAPIGIYSNYWSEDADYGQKLTEWEKKYSINCSTLNDFGYNQKITINPVVANNFTNKLLQESYEAGNITEYHALNQKIDEGYAAIEFKNKYILESDFYNSKMIRHYFRWLAVRYHRSLDGMDLLTADLIKNRLIDEFNEIYIGLQAILDDPDGLVNTPNMFSHINTVAVELLFLAKMIPDEDISLHDTKDTIISKLVRLKKKYTNQEEIIKWIEKTIDRLNDLWQWCNSDKPFIVDTTDWTIFGRG